LVKKYSEDGDFVPRDVDEVVVEGEQEPHSWKQSRA